MKFTYYEYDRTIKCEDCLKNNKPTPSKFPDFIDTSATRKKSKKS